ncbi:MAG: methyltransferase domain-containing protein [Luteimonas sp.]
MPVPSLHGQPEATPHWFATAPGRALLDSECDSVRAALDERPGQSWLWLSPPIGQSSADDIAHGPGLHLQSVPDGWAGSVRCNLPLPLASESVAVVVVQHVACNPARRDALVRECARVLLPGGRLTLYCLNPLSPWRWRWATSGLGASEPMPWRRQLRVAGLAPESVSQGLGPRWGMEPDAGLQHGPGLRAAWRLQADKRSLPLTPLRSRAPLRIGGGVPAA